MTTQPALTPAGSARLEAALRQGVERVFPAGVLLVRWQGHAVFLRAAGYLDPQENRLPTREETLFDLASLTKLFTATAFMRLCEAGIVSVDTPVASVLPAFRGRRLVGATEDPLAKVMVPADPRYQGEVVDLQTISFRRLLTHTSGLAAWRSLYNIGNAGTPFPHETPAEARRQRLAAVYGYDFACPVVARVLYSDLGFILLGEALEQLTGLGLEACLQQLVFDPLGLPHAGFNPRARGVALMEIAPTEVCGWRGRRLWGEVDDENAASLGGAAGHAGLFATAAEVAALGQMYLDASKERQQDFLAPATVQEMTRQQVYLEGLRRGLAWVLQTGENCSCGSRFSAQSFGHTGFTGTSLWVDPERELVVALLTNRVYYGRGHTNIQEFRPWLHDQVIAALELDTRSDLS